ncbi:MAG: hypothetical protein JKY42_05210 [Flavobacteriales bacterium]|nr:hypothetical protein [Flavobacteriales bacterium]
MLPIELVNGAKTLETEMIACTHHTSGILYAKIKPVIPTEKLIEEAIKWLNKN